MSKPFITRAPKRPVDKVIKTVRILDIPATAVGYVQRTAVVAETFVGANIQLSWAADLAGTFLMVMLIILRDGDTQHTIGLSNLANTYEPEESVLWSHGFVSTGTVGVDHSVVAKVKTMRKLKTGDRIVLIWAGSSANNGDIGGSVTSFYKQ